MLIAAARYGYLHAKVRALRSSRLGEQDRHVLLYAGDLKTCLAYLVTTSYGQCFDRTDGDEPVLSTLERRLARPLFSHYDAILHACHSRRAREVIIALLARFEVENLKVLLRARVRGEPKERVHQLLYPIGRLSRLNWDGLWQATTMADLLQMLRNEPYHRALLHALPQFEAQHRLFPLEMALDLARVDRLRQAVDQLGRRDRVKIGGIIELCVDVFNISWVIRLKTVYGLSPEEIIHYTIPAGKTVSLSMLMHLASAATAEEGCGRLPVALQRYLGGVAEWDEVEGRLGMHVVATLRQTLAGLPFHLGIAAAYLLEKEIELKNLVTLLQAKAARLTTKRILALVSWETTEKQYASIG